MMCLYLKTVYNLSPHVHVLMYMYSLPLYILLLTKNHINEKYQSVQTLLDDSFSMNAA